MLQQHGWWALLAIAVLTVVRGLVDLISGVTYQAEDMIGKTMAEIEAESVSGAQLSNFSVRTGGLYLIAYGVLLLVVLLFAFRRDQPWAWWAMWMLPGFAIAASLLDVAAGPVGTSGPAVTGAIAGALAAAILLVSAPRFFREPGRVLTDPGENRAG
jgi:hypothetical protein